MKVKLLLFLFSFLFAQLSAQVTWTRMADLPGPARDHAIGFSYGNKGYVMTGVNPRTGTQYNDFWEYNSATDTWTQLPNYDGPVRSYGCGGVINGKAYIGLGHSGFTMLTDWWQYDFSTSAWTPLNDFPGPTRDHPACEVLNGKLYVGFGSGNSGSINDWWQYDPATDAWTEKTKYPGTLMHHPVTATYNNLIYLSEGHLAGQGFNVGSTNFYSYNTLTDTWTTLADMPGPGVVAGASFYVGDGNIFSGCGITEPASAWRNQFYAYNIAAGTWSSVTSYPGTGAFGPVSFVINSSAYIATGMDASGTDTKELYRLTGAVALDAGISAVNMPAGTVCSASFTPVVTLRNFGRHELTSCTINYYMDNNANQTEAWTGSLALGASTQVTLTTITGVTEGVHTFTSSASNPNDSTDQGTGNDEIQVSFYANTTAAALPLSEGFEGSALPAGWTLWNPDNNTTWVIDSTVAKTGNHCMSIDNCSSPDITNQRDRFISRPYDFSTASSAILSFDVAYAAVTISGQDYSDSLAVFSSTDCGATWNQIYLKGGTTLATAPTMTVPAPDCFIPASEQWRTETISLSNLAGQASVLFAFENRSDWGEGIYIDNINITFLTGMAELNTPASFTIYPNPANTYFTIEGSANAKKIQYTVCNVIGEEVSSGEISGTAYGFKAGIQVSDIPKGLYFIRLTEGKNSWVKKVSIQ